MFQQMTLKPVDVTNLPNYGYPRSIPTPSVGTIQENSENYLISPPMTRGWVRPDLDACIDASRSSPPRAGLPTFGPVGNRANGALAGNYGYLNSAGGVTAIVVPPDRYWRARTASLKASKTLSAQQPRPSRGLAPGLSMGT